MSTTLTSEALAGYVAGWRARAEREEAEADAWRAALRRRVRQAAALLRDEFGATRVTLFGSLSRGTATTGSDVDLLVEGVAPAELFAAAAAVDRVLVDALVDLVPDDRARPEIRARARAEGEVLVG